MPRRLQTSPELPTLLARQDGVLSCRQAYAHGLTPDAVQHRVDIRRWRRILPGVLLTHDQPPSRRQRVYAARLWTGEDGVIDAASAAQWPGVHVPGIDAQRVQVVVPYDHPARTTSFVTVRRSRLVPAAPGTHWVRYVDLATALVVAARGIRDPRRVTELLSRPLQQGRVTVDDLLAAHLHAPIRGSRIVTRVLEQLCAGIRSPGEADARELMASSQLLPEAKWNVWLRLPDGGPLVCADALIEEAGMVVEVNGRTYHAWGLAFEETEARQLRVEAAGLTVAPLTPRRIDVAGPESLRHLEAIYLRLAGRGMPPGVEIVRFT
jgi:hypothetical protein